MDGNLEKVVAPWKFTIDAGGIYPSADGEAILGDLHVAISHGDAGWVTTSFNNIPKIVVSEILRNVDLISAVGERGHAKLIEDIEAEASRSRARREHWMRKRLAEDPVTVRSHLLERLFAKQIESGALSIADGKVLVSGYEIRIGDGAVYHGVDEIEVEHLKSVLMLPHDDKVAETIVVAVTSILAR